MESVVRLHLLDIPDIEFMYKTINYWLNGHSSCHLEERIKVVEYIFDDRTKFKDIRPPYSQPSPYDDCFIKAAIQKYRESEYFKESVLNPDSPSRNNPFFTMLSEIASFITANGQKEFDDGSLVLTKYREKRDGEKFKESLTLEELERLENTCCENYVDLLEAIDYTNPSHVQAVLTNFFEIETKYGSRINHPFYLVLRDFETIINSMKSEGRFKSNEHVEIIDAFMYFSSNKKEIAKFLNMKTERMMRTVKTCISPKISKFYSKYVGKRK